jgi:hypothetical protein
MLRFARNTGITSHLVDDEIIEVAFRGHRFSYRLRIWRARGRPAVVLVSQVPRGAPPAWLRSRLANLAYRAYLGFPSEGMLYFEDEESPGGRRLTRVHFATLGPELRRHLVEPVEQLARWDDLHRVLGCEVPH